MGQWLKGSPPANLVDGTSESGRNAALQRTDVMGKNGREPDVCVEPLLHPITFPPLQISG